MRKTIIEMALENAEKSLEDMKRKSIEAGKDAERIARLSLPWCLRCFYFRRERLAGQGFNKRNCSECGRIEVYSTTATDPFCQDCAIKLKRCKRCGQDM